LPAIDSKWHLAVLPPEEIKRPFFARCPVLNPVSDDDRFEWQDILADITLFSDVHPTMPVYLIDKLRSAQFCHDCPQTFGFPWRSTIVVFALKFPCLYRLLIEGARQRPLFRDISLQTGHFRDFFVSLQMVGSSGAIWAK
jgi:hypothetical protein